MLYMRTGRASSLKTLLTLLGAGVLCARATVHAQSTDPFGVQDRANAAQQLIVLAVQQAISSLPPTSGQSFTYDFNLELQTYVASERLGPTSFRVPQIVGAGRASVRLAMSYFDLSESFGPTPYKVLGQSYPDPPGYCTKFGMNASSRVGLINLAANYGLTNRLEANLNLPVVISDTQASEVFYSRDPNSNQVNPVQCNRLNNADAQPVTRPFSELQVGGGKTVAFNDGTNAGVGRISLGGKALLYSSESLDLAFSTEFFFPSPNQDQFAGPDSGAILPRLIAEAKFDNPLRLHADAGYDYDFDTDELRRFTWNAGASVALDAVHGVFDTGVGGSVFNQGIQWTPSSASFTDGLGRPASIQALEANRLGNNFVDFLLGIKIRLTDKSVASGAVSVPVNNEGFRAVAVGTLALEYYF